MTAEPTREELAILSRPGSWIVALAATNGGLTDLLISHIAAEGELVGWDLLEAFASWYMDAAAMGVDLTRVTSYLEELAASRSDDSELIAAIDNSFLAPIRSALDDDSCRIQARAAVHALGPVMQTRLREVHGVVHADPK